MKAELINPVLFSICSVTRFVIIKVESYYPLKKIYNDLIQYEICMYTIYITYMVPN